MRKMVFGRQLSRGRKSRTALFRSLIRALAISGKIVTTRAKAKAIIPQIDKLITAAKKNSISSRRKALSKLGNDRKTVDLLFLKIAPAFKERTSGFTRIILLPRRTGDMAEMVRLEWVEKIETEEKPKKEAKKKTGKELKTAKKETETKSKK